MDQVDTIIQMFELPERWQTNYEEYRGRPTTIAHYVFEDKTFDRCCCHMIRMRKVTNQRQATNKVTPGPKTGAVVESRVIMCATMVRVGNIMALLAQE